MRLSVVICTRDREDLIGQALSSVASCEFDDFDVHVMDQSTTDATEKVVTELREKFAGSVDIVYHHLDRAGLSRAYNAGFRVTTAPVVACTDDDVVVPSDWLANIDRAFTQDSELGLLYGQVVLPESLRDAGPDIIVPTLAWTKRERLHSRDRNFKVWGMGADMAIRRAAFEAVHGFDEALGGGAPLRSSQDFDFSLRVYRAGFAVLLDPSVTVDHYGARSVEQWPGTEVAYGIGDGAFYGKHIRCRDALALRLFVGRLARVYGRAAYQTVRQRRLVPVSAYGRNLVKGFRAGAKFDVDRHTRLYRESARARIGVTEANAVNGAHRAD